MSAPSNLFPLSILTPRLVLRHFTFDDLPAAHAIYSDPAIMQFSPFGPSSSLEATRDLIAGHRASYAEHGFGKWIVALRATGEIIGYCGVAMTILDGLAPEPELGYRFFPQHWGQGYATEAARAALDHCLNLVGLPRILGVVEPANAASVKVLLKLGMAYQRQTAWRGKTVDVYAVDKFPPTV